MWVSIWTTKEDWHDFSMPVWYGWILPSRLIFPLTVVIKMEGGTDHELRTLDAVTENEETKDKADDGEVSDASKDNEAEAGEVPDAPRSLHRTASIFFRHLAIQTTKEDLENVRNSFAWKSLKVYI